MVHVAAGDVANMPSQPFSDDGCIPAGRRLDAVLAGLRVALDDLVATHHRQFCVRVGLEKAHILLISSWYICIARRRITVPFSVRGSGLLSRVTRMSSLKMRLYAGAPRLASSMIGLKIASR